MFDLTEATKLYTTYKSLEILTMRYAVPFDEMDEEDAEEIADDMDMSTEQYILLTKNIAKAAKTAKKAFNAYELQFEIETLPVEYLKLTTSRFVFDESKVEELIDMA